MRSHDLKSSPASCGLIAFIPVMRFNVKATNNYGEIWILGKNKFKIQLKIFNKRHKFFHVLARRPIQTNKVT